MRSRGRARTPAPWRRGRTSTCAWRNCSVGWLDSSFVAPLRLAGVERHDPRLSRRWNRPGGRFEGMIVWSCAGGAPPLRLARASWGRIGSDSKPKEVGMPVVQTDPRARTRQGRPAGNIPVELSSFVGRDRELREIKRLLQDAHAITLTGPGGIGKTRLALRAGRKLARHFPDGVWLVELAEVETSDLVAYAFAHAMQLQERPGEAIEEALIAHLRERRLLVVLDNCEHLHD